MVGAKVRYRSPERVAGEFARLAGIGFRQINIADDLFTARAGHALPICAAIRERGIDHPWTAFARVDTVTPEILSAMRAAGCTAVSFGVETGDPQILKTIRKGITLSQAEAAVRMCVDAGVAPHISFILGLPGETSATMERTRAFGEHLAGLGAFYGFHFLAPFPGTRVRECADDYGIRILTDDWSRYHANRAVCETEAVFAGELDAAAEEWEGRYDKHLRGIAEKMAKGNATQGEIAELRGLERCVALYDVMMADVFATVGASGLSGENETERLADLAGRSAQMVDHSVDRLLDAFEQAFANRDLLLKTTGEGRYAPEWNDYPAGSNR